MIGCGSYGQVIAATRKADNMPVRAGSKLKIILKARLHRRYLSRQLDAIFVAPKLQLQNRTCKQGAIFSAICRRDIAGFSNMFETCCNFSATKIASSCCDKNLLCKRAFRVSVSENQMVSHNTSCNGVSVDSRVIKA